MRTIGILPCIGGVIASDPCTRLCEFDGTKVSTGGSWTKDGPGGSKICHAYHRKGPHGHCYHTTVTRATCPSTNPPIQPGDVYPLIAHVSTKRDQGTTIIPGPLMISTNPAEEDTNATVESTLLPREGTESSYESLSVSEADIDPSDLIEFETGYRKLASALIDLHNGHLDSDLLSLGDKVFEAIYGALESLRNPPFADPVMTFLRVRGHILFDYALRNSNRDYEFIRSALLLPMLLRVEPLDFQRFRYESGLAAFCSDHSDYIRIAFLQIHHEGQRVFFPDTIDMFATAFVGANLPKYCPELLTRFPELVPVVIEQRLYMSVVDTGGIPALEQWFRRPRVVSRAHPFTESIQEIMSRHPKSLRCITALIRFEGQIDMGKRVGREFISLAAEEIFKTPRSVYFRASDANRIEIQPTGPLDHYEAIGRFIGHSLAHDVSLGVSLPDQYLALFLGKNAEVNVEQAVKARLDLMVRGFQAVVPPDLIEDFVTVERLALTFLGTPVINVAELIVRLDFQVNNPVNQGAPIQISWLIRYLESLNQDNLKRFTRLLCGRSVAPIGGLSSIRPRMGVLFGETPDGHPRAQAHASNIVVPLYDSEEELIQSFNGLLSGLK